jgi:hypothetical protein
LPCRVNLTLQSGLLALQGLSRPALLLSDIFNGVPPWPAPETPPWPNLVAEYLAWLALAVLTEIVQLEIRARSDRCCCCLLYQHPARACSVPAICGFIASAAPPNALPSPYPVRPLQECLAFKVTSAYCGGSKTRAYEHQPLLN